MCPWVTPLSKVGCAATYLKNERYHENKRNAHPDENHKDFGPPSDFFAEPEESESIFPA